MNPLHEGRPHALTLARRARAMLPQACALAAIAALSDCGGTQQPIGSVLQEIGFDQRLDSQVPLDLSFRDEDGHAVKLGDSFGKKPVVLTLVYYQCPMLCTQVLDGVVHSLRAMNLEPGPDYVLVTASIDTRDTPEMARAKKAAYVQEFARAGAGEAWHFLTASDTGAVSLAERIGQSGRDARAPRKGDDLRSIPTSDSAARLAESIGFRYHYDPDIGQFAHASGFVVLTPQGRVSKYFYGIEYSPRDLRLALVESSQGEIGTFVDQILLLCYHYDPMTGRYGLVVLNVIRALGVLTVGLIAGFVIVMLRRERLAARMQAGG